MEGTNGEVGGRRRVGGSETMRYHKCHMLCASLSPLPAWIRHDLIGMLTSWFMVMTDRGLRSSMGRIGVSYKTK